MSPTPDEIAAMSARGWAWDPELRMFHIGGGLDSEGCAVLSLRVMLWDGRQWRADYGTRGISYAPWARHDTPEKAADEAEAWLRGVLAPLGRLLDEPAALLRELRRLTSDPAVFMGPVGRDYLRPDGTSPMWFVYTGEGYGPIGTGPTEIAALRDALARLEKP